MVARTMFVAQETGVTANALDISKDCSQVVIAGRSVFKVYNIEEDEFVERANLRVGKHPNLNFSCNDVVWSPVDDQIIATAATNGAVVLWNLNKQSRSKQDVVFNDHKRTVNKVNFHPSEAGLLISGSQDGTMKLFDIRNPEKPNTFDSNTESVRDVQFNPHQYWQFAAVSENGKVQLWDMRRPDKCERQWPAHSNHVFACDWHPEVRNWLATAGRDQTIKVWDTTRRKEPEYTIYPIGPVGRVKWRPQRRDYLSSSAITLDFAINVWDINRPYVPFASFNQHKDVTTGIAWRGDPHTFLSTSRDGTLYQHVFSDAVRPGDKANPVGLAVSNRGEITHAHRHSSKAVNKRSLVPEVFRRPPAQIDLFRMCMSRMLLYVPNVKLGLPSGASDESIAAEIARRYRIQSSNLASSCEENANVARALGKNQVALSWTVLKSLYACSRTEMARRVSGDLTAAGGEVDIVKTRTRLRSQNGKGGTSRNVSGNESRKSVTDSDSGEEGEKKCMKLTEIATGVGTLSGLGGMTSITGDFFGDGELAGMGVEHLVSLEGGGGTSPASQVFNNADWVLPTEAFDQRREIKEPCQEDEIIGDEGGSDGTAMQTVTVEDKTSEVVVWTAVDTRPLWSPSEITSETLNWLAEHGDVQSAVSMYLVLRGDVRPVDGAGVERTKGLVPDAVLEQWFLSYIELLQKLKLFTVANKVLSLCPLVAVHSLNQQSTMVYSNCTTCGKSLCKTGGSWWCQGCRRSPVTCAVCHSVVKGLFVWCQGCGHGGHIDHIKQWIETKTWCPAGCGHHCVYH